MKTRAWCAVLALVVANAIVALSARGAQSATKKAAVSAAGAQVTAVTGPSTLHHLRRTIETSSMGWAGHSSALPDLAALPLPRAGLRGDFVLSGSDLYRISCRACHRADGTGAPPEINSLLGPVQAASVQWMTARMKSMGRPADRAFIRELTSGTEADLRKRFKEGGHNMPSFDHLSDDEIGALRPYLDQMAGLTGVEARLHYIAKPSARIGELIVKGTCHICHDATGPENVPTTVLSDVIPPLSSMPHQKSFAEFVRKVREGATIPLGSGGVLSRGRMPIFNYLTEREVEAAYLYLSLYPPK